MEGVSLLGNLVDDILFEEKLQEIDCDLRKFDGKIQVSEAVKLAMNSMAATIQPTTHVLSVIRKYELTQPMESGRAGLLKQTHLESPFRPLVEKNRAPFADLTNVELTSPKVKPKQVAKWSKIAWVAQGETDGNRLSELPRERPSIEISNQKSQKKRGVVANGAQSQPDSSVVVGVQPHRLL